MLVPVRARGQITREMSVYEVGLELSAIKMEKIIIERFVAECVDGEALHHFTVQDFANFGVKYGPMVKIRSLVKAHKKS